MISYFIFFLFVISFFSFFIQRKTILSTLLVLEAIILLTLFQLFILKLNSSPMMIFILVIAACESAAGLTLLVFFSRSEETDKIFFLKC